MDIGKCCKSDFFFFFFLVSKLLNIYQHTGLDSTPQLLLKSPKCRRELVPIPEARELSITGELSLNPPPVISGLPL